MRESRLAIQGILATITAEFASRPARREKERPREEDSDRFVKETSVQKASDLFAISDGINLPVFLYFHCYFRRGLTRYSADIDIGEKMRE